MTEGLWSVATDRRPQPKLSMKESVLAQLRSAETRLFEAMRDPRAATLAELTPCEWSIDRLAGHRFCLVVTFRRDGRAVPTPMWFGVDGERVYVRSAVSDGKIKRLRANRHALVAPCTFRGAPLGRPMRAIGRILPSSEAAAAESAIAAHYGLERQIYELTRARILDPAYVELSASEEAAS